MTVTDIALSLMREQDMRPLASILEAVACGAPPILSDRQSTVRWNGSGSVPRFAR